MSTTSFSHEAHCFIPVKFQLNFLKGFRLINALSDWFQQSDIYLVPDQTCIMKIRREISYQSLAVNFLHKKALSSMFDWVLNTPLTMY